MWQWLKFEMLKQEKNESDDKSMPFYFKAFILFEKGLPWFEVAHQQGVEFYAVNCDATFL